MPGPSDVVIAIKAKDEASRVLDDFSKKSGKSFEAIRKKVGVAMTAMGGAITGVVGVSIKQFAEMGDAIQKMALRTGFSTEALSELRHMTELSGASFEALNPAIRRMQRVIAQGDEASKAWKNSLAAIGLTVGDLQKIKPEEQFYAILEAIAKLPDAATRTDVAFNLLGDSGTALIPMLSGGAEGMERMRQEAHDLGIVLDKEAADKAAEFNDANTRLKASLSSIKIVIAEALIPAIKPLVDKIAAVVKRVSEWMRANPKLARVITIVVAALGGLMLVLGPLLLMLPAIASGIGMVGAAMTMAMGPIGLIVLAIMAAIAVGYLIIKNWDKIKAKAKEVGSKIAGFFGGLKDKVVGHFQKMREGAGKALDLFRKKVEEHGGGIKGVVLAATEGYAEIGKKALELLGIDADKAQRFVIERFEAIVDFFKNIPARIRDAFRGLADIIKSPFESAFDDIREAFAGLPGKIKDLFGKIPTPKIPSYEAGGVVTKPTLAVVGEKPEAIIPLGRRFGTGLTVNINVGAFMGKEEDAWEFARLMRHYIHMQERLA